MILMGKKVSILGLKTLAYKILNTNCISPVYVIGGKRFLFDIISNHCVAILVEKGDDLLRVSPTMIRYSTDGIEHCVNFVGTDSPIRDIPLECTIFVLCATPQMNREYIYRSEPLWKEILLPLSIYGTADITLVHVKSDTNVTFIQFDVKYLMATLEIAPKPA